LKIDFRLIFNSIWSGLQLIISVTSPKLLKGNVTEEQNEP